jgi:D-beta-D-heptose 7-phosphate kinase/D-beta-D-heptose 1-phosphate adenosyltransferase
VIAGTHQIVRVDREDVHSIGKETEESLFNKLRDQLNRASIVILSDYNKGLLTHSLSQSIIGYCAERQVKVIVDPKGLDYGKYCGAYIIKPNRKELAEAAKIERISTEDDLVRAARVILQSTGASYLVVTLSESGIAIIDQQSYKMIPVAATEVYDVTGAGDTVIATLAYCLSHGFNVEEAAMAANHAASIVIKHIGSATTTIPEVITSLKKY